MTLAPSSIFDSLLNQGCRLFIWGEPGDKGIASLVQSVSALEEIPVHIFYCTCVTSVCSVLESSCLLSPPGIVAPATEWPDGKLHSVHAPQIQAQAAGV